MWTQLRSETRCLYGLLLLGIVIREAFSFWTGHPWDFEVWVRVGYYASKGINPYGLLDPVPGLTFSGEGTMTSIGYPPLWAFISAFMYVVYSVIGNGNRFVYYFLLKQPSILGDLATGYLIFRIVKEQGNVSSALSAARFWMLCPLTILVSSIWGIFDGLTLALILAAFLSLKHTASSAFFLGVGAYLKSIPAIFAPALSFARNGKHSLVFLAVALGAPIILTILPFVVFQWDLSGFMLMLGSQSSRPGQAMTVWAMLQFLPRVSHSGLLQGALSVASVLWIVALLLTYVAYAAGVRPRHDPKRIIAFLIVVVSVFLITRLYVPEQYAVYPVAFLLLDTHTWHVERNALLDATWKIATAFLVVNNTLLIRFVSPISSWAWHFDLAVNNGSPTAAVRYTALVILGCAFFLTMVQVLRTYYKDTRGPLESWIFGAARRAIRSPRAAWYAAYFLVFVFFSLSIDSAVTLMVTDWSIALDQPTLFGVNLLGLYHLFLLVSALGFNALIASVRGGSFVSKSGTFLNLFGLDAIAVGIDLPAYDLIMGRLPLTARACLVIGGYVDERALFMIAIVMGLTVLLLVQNLTSLARPFQPLSFKIRKRGRAPISR